MHGLSLGLDLDRLRRIGGGVSPPRPLTDGLVAFYRFDGNLLDGSENGHHFVSTQSAPSYPAGVIGQRLSTLDPGGATYPEVTIPGFVGRPIAGSAWAVSAWLWALTEPAPANYGMFSLGMTVSGTGAVLAYTFNNGVTRTLTLQATEFEGEGPPNGMLTEVVVSPGVYHVVITCDGSGLVRGYLDGSLVVTQQIATAPDTFNGYFFCGSSGGGGVDLLGVWNRALSAADVTTLYNSGGGFDPTPPPEFAALDFSKAANSQYFFLNILW